MIRVDFVFDNAPTVRLTRVWDAAHGGRLVCSQPRVNQGALTLCGTCSPCQYWWQGYGRA